MADMKAMMRESAKAKREMEEMRRKAEADLDEILDEAIAEFEAEEDLTEKRPFADLDPNDPSVQL